MPLLLQRLHELATDVLADEVDVIRGNLAVETLDDLIDHAIDLEAGKLFALLHVDGVAQLLAHVLDVGAADLRGKLVVDGGDDAASEALHLDHRVKLSVAVFRRAVLGLRLELEVEDVACLRADDLLVRTTRASCPPPRPMRRVVALRPRMTLPWLSMVSSAIM